MKIRLLILMLATAAFAAAQTPRFVNAKVDQVTLSGNLDQAFHKLVDQQTGAAWIGYAAPTRPDDRTMCCFDSMAAAELGCCGCRLESHNNNSFVGHTDDSNCGPIEPSHTFFVLYRAEDHRITRIRSFSVGCALDVAGLPVHWIEGVKPAESIALLTSLAASASADADKHSYVDGAVMAIALHDVPEADGALDKLMATEQPERVREKAAFWAGVERGEAGLRLLTKYVQNDPSDHFREKVIFAISQNKSPDAIKELIDLARHDPSSHVRGQAIFWMAQAGGKKVAQNITQAIEDDPETEVKKKAVFALTQMPEHEGIPMLIQVARTNKNPVVRKQAIFWLGQSQDPRAVDFLEQILTGPASK